MKRFWIGKIAKGIVFFVVFGALLGFVVMNLWNCLMPTLFTGTHVFNTINFWQAIGLIILSKILFGGFHKGHQWGHNKFGGHGRFGGMEWKQRWADKLSKMNPEDRERFKTEMNKRCRMWGSKTETTTAATPESDVKM